MHIFPGHTPEIIAIHDQLDRLERIVEEIMAELVRLGFKAPERPHS